MIQDNCTFKESLILDLKPPLESNTHYSLNFGQRIGKRVTLSAKLPSRNDTKSVFNGIKHLGMNLLMMVVCIILLMKNAIMKKLIGNEKIAQVSLITGMISRNSVRFRMT